MLAVANPSEEGALHSRAGFESLWPDRTNFLIHDDCEDRRFEVWRSLTYQFTHADLGHVSSNALLILFLGISLEGFHGHLITMVSFNFGVICGALNHAVSNGHSRLIGMSAGAYALLGMHAGELVLNWRQMRYRLMKSLVLLFILLCDVANYATTRQDGSVSQVGFASHLGGALAGLIIAIIFVRNLKVYRCERVLQAVVVVATVAIASFAIFWLLQWAPRTIWDPKPWCWARSVADFQEFGNVQWHCVRCLSQACIERWSAFEHIVTVNHAECGEWGYTEM